MKRIIHSIKRDLRLLKAMRNFKLIQEYEDGSFMIVIPPTTS